MYVYQRKFGGKNSKNFEIFFLFTFRYEAAKAQLATAATGMTGACVAIWINAVDADKANSLWILPFSAGGFLNIALVSVLPEILNESTNDPKELIIQFIFVLLGILVMSLLCLI